MRIYVSIGDKTTSKWRSVAAWDSDETSSNGPDTFGWKRQLVLPNEEALEFVAGFDIANQGFGMAIHKDGEQLFQLGGFKLTPSTYSTIILLTPKGLHVQVTLGD